MSTLIFGFTILKNVGDIVTHFWLFDRDLPFRTRRGDFRLRVDIPRVAPLQGAVFADDMARRAAGRHHLRTPDRDLPFEVSMGTWRREEYDWHDDLCVYLDDVEWRPVVEVQPA